MDSLSSFIQGIVGLAYVLVVLIVEKDGSFQLCVTFTCIKPKLLSLTQKAKEVLFESCVSQTQRWDTVSYDCIQLKYFDWNHDCNWSLSFN